MLIPLIKLELLKRMRSSSFSKSLAIGVVVFIIGFFLLTYLFLFGLVLNRLITDILGIPDAVHFINSCLLYFFMIELIYRYFIQQLPVFSLENFLHLPLSKSKIIHFLLGSSFISPLNIISLLIFGPFAMAEIQQAYGLFAALTWLVAVVLTSWSIHWFILWFKQRFEDSLTGTLSVFSALLLGIGLGYFGFFDLGAF